MKVHSLHPVDEIQYVNVAVAVLVQAQVLAEDLHCLGRQEEVYPKGRDSGDRIKSECGDGSADAPEQAKMV